MYGLFPLHRGFKSIHGHVILVFCEAALAGGNENNGNIAGFITATLPGI